MANTVPAAEPLNPATIAARLTTHHLGRSLVCLPVTGSTNDDLWKSAATDAAPHGAVVATDHQRTGRGRRGNRWVSAPGLGLQFSVLLEPALPTHEQGLLGLFAGVAVVQALDRWGVATGLKWPNDILVGRDKLGGILSERKMISSKTLIVIGIGLNVAQTAADFPPELTHATSVHLAGGQNVSREHLLAEILNRLEPLLDGNPAAVIPLWLQRCVHLDRKVRFSDGTRDLEGIFRGISDSGQGLLDVAGRRVTVSAGLIELTGSRK